MIDEPYRWVEAIANRREYIENELAPGSPTIALSCQEGILFLTFGKDRKKIFEIYDRIALGGIGHPGDIERLRMMAIELASTEGFARSVSDVSLRRMATYSFSPALKQAFEQVYGAPYLARLLFAEVGATPTDDLFVALDYDGSMTANSMGSGKGRDHFSVISGSRRSAEQIAVFLRNEPVVPLDSALALAVRAWGVGLYTLDEDHADIPPSEELKNFLQTQLKDYSLEAGLLERKPKTRIAFTELGDDRIASVLSEYRSSP
jgi:proteasome alpha subunit